MKSYGTEILFTILQLIIERAFIVVLPPGKAFFF
jgi:hypothetical protein